MLRIAHLSDVHILDPHTRRSAARYRITARAVSIRSRRRPARTSPKAFTRTCCGQGERRKSRGHLG